MQNFKIEIKWAIIFAIAQLLWMAFEKAIDLHDTLIYEHPLYTNLFAIVAILVFVFALKDKKKNYFNGIMNWRQGFITGIIISIGVAILSPLVQYLINTVITPTYFSNAIIYAVDSGKMTQANAEALYNLKSYIIQGAFGALAMGTVTAAIVSFFLKSKPIKTQ